MQGAEVQSATPAPTKTVADCSVNVPAESLLGHVVAAAGLNLFVSV